MPACPSADGKPSAPLGQAPPFPTSTGGQGAAPLAVAATLGLRRPLQHVAGAAGEVDHVVQVELAAVGEPVGGVARVPAGDGCRGDRPPSPSPASKSPATDTHAVWSVWVPGHERIVPVLCSLRRKDGKTPRAGPSGVTIVIPESTSEKWAFPPSQEALFLAHILTASQVIFEDSREDTRH